MHSLRVHSLRRLSIRLALSNALEWCSQVVLASSTKEKLDAAVESIGPQATGFVVDSTDDGQVFVSVCLLQMTYIEAD